MTPGKVNRVPAVLSIRQFRGFEEVADVTSLEAHTASVRVTRVYCAAITQEALVVRCAGFPWVLSVRGLNGKGVRKLPAFAQPAGLQPPRDRVLPCLLARLPRGHRHLDHVHEEDRRTLPHGEALAPQGQSNSVAIVIVLPLACRDLHVAFLDQRVLRLKCCLVNRPDQLVADNVDGSRYDDLLARYLAEKTEYSRDGVEVGAKLAANRSSACGCKIVCGL